MSTALSIDPVLSLVVKTLSRIEHRDVDYRELCMAAIVRNGYYLGLSYKSDQTFAVWRSGSETIEFYSRETGDLLDIAQVSETPISVDNVPTSMPGPGFAVS